MPASGGMSWFETAPTSQVSGENPPWASNGEKPSAEKNS